MDNQSYKHFEFNSLIIIDAIPEYDYQTAQRLAEDVQHKIRPAKVRHEKVHNRLQFMELMLGIIVDSYNKKSSPILHLEGHGSELYFSLPSGENIDWSIIADILRSLNKIMDNTLVTFIGCCHGFNFINSISILKFTPVSYIISPLGTIQGGLLEKEMNKFYNCLFEFNDITRAKNKLDNTIMGFLDADELFIKSINSYFQTKTRGSSWDERKESLISEAIKGDVEWEYLSEYDKKARLKHYRKLLKDMKSTAARINTYNFYSNRFLGYIRLEAQQKVLNMLNHNIQ